MASSELRNRGSTIRIPNQISVLISISPVLDFNLLNDFNFSVLVNGYILRLQIYHVSIIYYIEVQISMEIEEYLINKAKII